MSPIDRDTGGPVADAPLTPREFEELLPFYVNGTLQPAGRDAVEAYLKAHPKARGELHWHESLQTRLREDVPAVSSEVGLERAMARIRAEAGARHAAADRPSKASSSNWFDAAVRGLRHAVGSLGGLVPQPVLRPALAVAGVVIAVQAVVIGGLAGAPEPTAEWRGAAGTSAPALQGPFLKVNFKPDAREADLRLLLVQVNGTLVAGPGQLGDYYVQVPAASVPTAERTLRASPVVDAVAVVDGLPARP